MNSRKISSILVCMDGARPELPRLAARVAGRTKATLKLVDFIADLPLYRSMAVPNYAELAGLARSLKRERLEKAARRLTAQGIQAEAAVLDGRADAGVFREVESQHHDLVMIAAEREGDRYHAGKTGMCLLRKCPHPVWIVKPGRWRQRMKVVVAVATQPGDSAAADLNASLLCLARNVAEWLGGELHVLHVWYAYGESMLLHSHFASLSPEEVAVYVERTRLQHADEINALLGRCQADVPSNRVHLVKGDPQDAIAEFCRSEGVDLLVMGTVARKGLAAALIGNTAERIASDLPSSVFVVKPAWLAAQSDRAGVHESRQEDVDPVPHSGHGFGSAARSAVGS